LRSSALQTAHAFAAATFFIETDVVIPVDKVLIEDSRSPYAPCRPAEDVQHRIAA
jgi:hypothetical protein